MTVAGTTWVIDAYNVLGARPDGWWHERALALARLCDDIAAWRSESDVVVVMVDGWPTPEVPEGTRRGVAVRYARRRGPDSADRAIVDLVEDLLPVHPVVVTSDRRLRGAVAPLGAALRGAGAFRDMLDGSASG